MSRVRALAKRLVYRMLLNPLPRPFEHVAGHSWRSRLRSPSTTMLFENGRYLGPEHSRSTYSENVGRGWFCRTSDYVDFSTSDNSDPNSNGREYTYATSRKLHARNSGAPDNLRDRQSDAQQIQHDVEYALRGMQYIEFVRQTDNTEVTDRTVLELGPGFNCGWAVLLACHGARPIVVDPYPVAWQEEYHVPFFEELRSRLHGTAGCDTTAIGRLLLANDFIDDVIRRIDCPVELLDLEDASVDIVYSNAVAEHFYDVDQAFRQIARVTKNGGLGFHQVDFRDHRDFQRPLEYLLMSDDEFAIEFGLHRGEIGNRVRAAEMSRSIEKSGLTIVDLEENLSATDEYLLEFVRRLRASADSPYQNVDEQELRTLSGRITTRKNHT